VQHANHARRFGASIMLFAALATPAAVGQAPATRPAGPTMSEDLTADTLEAWHAFIRPTEAERRWLEIPWRTSFWQSVLDSQRERKPILLWAMNGHPMGCV